MKLYYHVTGHGHPLVILHGLFGSGDNFYTLSKFFGDKYKVYAVDQRNHGRSPHSDVFNYQAMAGDLNDLLVHEGVSSIYLLGHSMGGKTAMQFSLSYPERVDKLIAVDIGPRKYPPQHDEIFEALFALDLDKYKTRGELDAALARYLSDYAVRQLLLKNVARDNAGSFTWKVDVKAIHRNYENVNAEIGADRPFLKPTLFLRGGRSRYVLDEDLPGIRALFPAARLVTVDGVGHWVHAEAPQEFASHVMEFLAEN